MSVPQGCLLNLRRHYFATQHDCIHIIRHPAKVAGTPLARRPCVWGPWRGGEGGFNQRDGDPSALMDSRIKAGLNDAPISLLSEEAATAGQNGRRRTPNQQRLTYGRARRPSLRSREAEVRH